MATAAAAAAVARARPKIVRPVFLCCDIQERFRDLIHDMPAVIATSGALIRVAKQLSFPVIATEQYPKAMLRTVSELSGFFAGPDAAAVAPAPADDSAGAGAGTGEGGDGPGFPVFEKTLFSMATDEVLAELEKSSPDSIVIFGIETHICVLQTSLDMLRRGYSVYVVVDAVSSQRPFDRTVALQALQAAGAVLTTSESFVYELLGDAKAEHFKPVAKIMRDFKPGTHGLSSL